MLNGFNKIMSTGDGFNKVIMYILPSMQEREILLEATRTCVWLKLDVCSMRVRFATQQHNTSGLINHQVKYFAKANSAFTIPYIEGMADLKFTNLRLFPCFRIELLRSQSVYHLRRPRLSPSRLLLPRPDWIALNDRIKRAFPFHH